MKITLLDKITRDDIKKNIDLDITYSIRSIGKFTEIDFEGEDKDIFEQYLLSTYRQGFPLKNLKQAKYLGKLVDVGKFGYGIYCDIGSEKDALIDLNTLRKTFGGKLSTRQYISKYGLVNGLCVEVNLTQVKRGIERVWAELSPEWIETFLKEGTIFVSDVEEGLLKNAVAHSPFRDSIIIGRICSTSFTLTCSGRTEPPGVVSYLGKMLRKARFGIVGEY